MQADSVSKIVERYFATVTKQTFVFNDHLYAPRVLIVSPLLLRGYTCPPMCGGCCFKFTLDYLPTEERPPGAVKRRVRFNERWVEIWSDAQEDNDTDRCRHLRREDGRCGIYETRPFTCDFELIRTIQSVDEKGSNYLTQKLFGRGWSYPRVDGGRGALCEMTHTTPKTITEVSRKLHRLQEWADHFQLRTWCPELIRIVDEGYLLRSERGLILDNQSKGFGL